MTEETQIIISIAQILVSGATIYISITGIRSSRAARKELELTHTIRRSTAAKQDGRLTEVDHLGDLTITNCGELSGVNHD